MQIKNTFIPGCYELFTNMFKDNRGLFVKTFHSGVFEENKLETCFTEEFYTYSRRGVLRGLHFQIPPMDHDKLVYCVDGEVIDAVLDLRVGSPTYGKHVLFSLSAEKGNMIYMPRGTAHGFYTVSSHSILIYKVTSVYSPEHDTGVLWNSAGIPWPDKAPILSLRDTEFTPLKNFDSPFIFQKRVAEVG